MRSNLCKRSPRIAGIAQQSSEIFEFLREIVDPKGCWCCHRRDYLSSVRVPKWLNRARNWSKLEVRKSERNILFVLDTLRRKIWKSTMDSDGFSGYCNFRFALACLKDVRDLPVVSESLPRIIGGCRGKSARLVKVTDRNTGRQSLGLAVVAYHIFLR